MSYQEQLAYLRQKREMTANTVTQAPSSVAMEQAVAPQEQWQEMDEDTIRAIDERNQKDQWLADAGENVDISTSMDPSRVDQDQQDLFKKEFDADPLTQKYGEKVDRLLQELYQMVQDPNSPMNGEQAFAMFQDTLGKMMKGDYDKEAEDGSE